MHHLRGLSLLASFLTLILLLDSCTKETVTTNTVTGPTVYDTTVVHDTVRVYPSGIMWTSVNSGIVTTLIDVAMSDPNRILAVGSGGGIIGSIDGGTTWSRQQSGVGVDLYGISFAGTGTAVAVGDYGTIIRTTDGGTTWAKEEWSENFMARAIQFASPTLGFIVGTDPGGVQAEILRTTDGGATWSKVLDRADYSGLYGVDFVNQSVGTVTGKNGTILRTTNGGDTWTPQSSGVTTQLIGVDFFDTNIGMAVGGAESDYRTILRTTNGGATWTAYPVTSGGLLYRVHLGDATHAIAAGYNGAILKTSDGGGTWLQQLLATQQRLLSMAFVNDSTGVIVGDGGTVLMARTH